VSSGRKAVIGWTGKKRHFPSFIDLTPHNEMLSLIEGFGHFVTSMPAPSTSSGSDFGGRASHPLESAALSRRTPFIAVRGVTPDDRYWLAAAALLMFSTSSFAGGDVDAGKIVANCILPDLDLPPISTAPVGRK
jgi:hypothetical protein